MSDVCTEATLRQLLSDVAALEEYRDTIKDQVTTFLANALGFDLTSLSTPSEVANDVLNNFLPATIGCDSSSISPVADYIRTCIFPQKAELARKIKRLNEDVVDTVVTLLSVPETLLFQALQELYALFEKYGMETFLNALDLKITCISTADDLGVYASDLSDINDRIDAVVADLPMTDEGAFDIDELTESLDNGLAANLKIYFTQAQDTVAKSIENLNIAKSLASNLNPIGRF